LSISDAWKFNNRSIYQFDSFQVHPADRRESFMAMRRNGEGIRFAVAWVLLFGGAWNDGCSPNTIALVSAWTTPSIHRLGAIQRQQFFGKMESPSITSLKLIAAKSIIHRRSQLDDSVTSAEKSPGEKLDRWLSRGTNAFPFCVMGSALIGYLCPKALLWVNYGSIVTILLASVMFGTGVTLEKEDFTSLWQVPSNRGSVPLGVLCQFIIMPVTAYIVGKLLLLGGSSSPSSIQSALFLGLCLVGASPGGTASNLVSLIAQADVALSVVLTTCSTLAAVVVTPLWIRALVGSKAVGIPISGWSLCAATAQVVLLPVLSGMFVKSRTPKLAATIGRFTPFVSVLLVSILCGGVVAQTAPLLGTTAAFTLPIVLASVLALHSIGFLLGYWVPKKLYPGNEKMARTISIEVGMQNSALAVVLARSIPGVHPAASLPGALSATVHSCLGSLLAAVWRRNSGSEIAKDPSG
jgi:bile acid:Na+ symporter, BASS family